MKNKFFGALDGIFIRLHRVGSRELIRAVGGGSYFEPATSSFLRNHFLFISSIRNDRRLALWTLDVVYLRLAYPT